MEFHGINEVVSYKIFLFIVILTAFLIKMNTQIVSSFMFIFILNLLCNGFRSSEGSFLIIKIYTAKLYDMHYY